MHIRKWSQDTRLFNTIGQRARSQFHQVALILEGCYSVNVSSMKMKEKGMYGIQVAMVLWYSSFGFSFGFKDLLTPPLGAKWDFQKIDHSLNWLRNRYLCCAFCQIPSLKCLCHQRWCHSATWNDSFVILVYCSDNRAHDKVTHIFVNGSLLLAVSL